MDGVEIFTETWLPAPKAGRVPPKRVPTVLVMSPYHAMGRPEARAFLETVVPRGYAFTAGHVRGFGESGGCAQLLGPLEASDSARVIEYLGRDAAWSNGRVGMYGLSYPGSVAAHAATRGGQVSRKFLKAIVIGAPTLSFYDLNGFDGVTQIAMRESGWTSYLQYTYDFVYSGPGGARFAAEKAPCFAEHAAASEDQSGDVTPYFAERDARAFVGNLRAPTFVWQGHADLKATGRGLPLNQVGFFERIPRGTPKFGMFGAQGHAYPDEPDAFVDPDWRRVDFIPAVLAWFDRHLMGLDTGVESWPVAQVQGNDGQWRAEPNWPTTGGPVGHLPLQPGGGLGRGEPDGTIVYREAPFQTTLGYAPGTSAVFETGPLPRRFELTGQPVLDLWVSLDRPDAHIAARLQTFDKAGEAIPGGENVGTRSARHLEPLVENRFAQAHGKPPPVGVPIRIAVRFQPTDLVVPAGGSIRLTVAGSVIASGGFNDAGVPKPLFHGPTTPSGSPTQVTILHDCRHLSALRFLMPRQRPKLLNVREPEEQGPLRAVRGPLPSSDAGGLAAAPVCGKIPIRLPMFGPPLRF